MKKAVIAAGGKQYLVTEGEQIKVELLHANGKVVTFDPLLVIDGDAVQVGKPHVEKTKVTAEIVKGDERAEKVTAIRYKAKKRVRTVRGHRQHHSVIKITSIA